MERNDPRVPLRFARFASAALCAIAAVNHARLAFAGEPSVGRHWVFVGVNVLLGTLVVLAPRAALVLAVPLAAQQAWSHGRALLASIAEPPFDWASLGVLLFFPALLIVLALTVVQERRVAHGDP
ncbi:MAG: hypothetical protein ABI551_12790 [Polyangiaceae bacterium]